MNLTMQITDAGRAALADAENTGTLPLTLSEIALGSASYTPTADQTALQNEVKRVTTFGGDAVADDTLHVTIRDESADAYTLGEFGLITDGGVLFAVYSQPNQSILEKNSSGIVLLSADIIFTTVDVTSLSVGPTGFLLPPGTTSTQGVVQLATPTETVTGSDTAKVVTPAADKAALDAHRNESPAHSWVQISGKPATATRWPAWNEVTSKPSTFTPSAHNHPWAEITGAPSTATRWPAWSEVTSKPSSFNPAAHSHSWSEIPTEVPGDRPIRYANAPGLPNASVNTGGGLYPGNGDGATASTANVKIASWNGIGFAPTISGQSVPRGENAVWIDVRKGDIGFRGKASGDGSGLTSVNAATFSGLSPSKFLRSDTSGSFTGGLLTVRNASNALITSGSSGLEILNDQTTGGDAFIVLHVGNDFRVAFGLGGAENDLVVGGFSMGQARHKVWHAGNVPSTATRWPAWSEVTSKPSTATRWPNWSEVTSKPSTFTPSAHSHAWGDISGAPFSSSRTNPSTTTILSTAGMNDHRQSNDHDDRYLAKGLAYTAVGQTVFARRMTNGQVNGGQTIAGSSLRLTNGGGVDTTGAQTLSGTYMALSATFGLDQSNSDGRTGLFVRIA